MFYFIHNYILKTKKNPNTKSDWIVIVIFYITIIINIF